jgi:hypothetical protein
LRREPQHKNNESRPSRQGLIRDSLLSSEKLTNIT